MSDVERRRAARESARALSPLWITGAVGVVAILAYATLVILSFWALALGDGRLPARALVLVVAAPTVLLTTMVVLGTWAAHVTSGWLADRHRLRRVHPFALGLVGAAAATVTAAAVPTIVVVGSTYVSV